MVQQEGLSAIKAETASLLVRLEALQEMITNVACLHRIFFQWLVARARAQGGAVSEGTAVSDAGDGEHQHALNMFLEHCIVADPLMEELEVCCLAGCALMAHLHVLCSPIRILLMIFSTRSKGGGGMSEGMEVCYIRTCALCSHTRDSGIHLACVQADTAKKHVLAAS